MSFATTVVLFLGVTSSSSTIFCPYKCLCPEPNVILCNATNLHRIPVDWPKSLRSLSISHCPLEKLPKNGLRRYNRLETLKLHKNRLNSIEKFAFRGLKRLKMLSIRYNDRLERLARFSFSQIRSLFGVELHLQNNAIQHIEPRVFVHNKIIRKLDLRGNPIAKLESKSLGGLHRVDFLYLPSSVRHIGQYTFMNSSRIHLLQMADVHLPDLIGDTFHGLSHVRSLIIKECQLGTVHGRAFGGVHTIHYIRIENCEIGRLHSHVFNDMTNVGTVQVTENRISRIDRGLFDSRIALRFQDNSIDCSCENMWMMRDSNISKSVLGTNYCMSPRQFEYRTLIDVDSTFIGNCSLKQWTTSTSDRHSFGWLVIIFVYSILI